MAKFLFSALMLLCLVPTAFAADEGVYRLAGVDANLPVDDLEPFAKMISGAKVVALGESVHTSRGFYQAKFRLIKYLVEKQGYRIVAMETPWQGANAATQYVENCSGDAKTASASVFRVFQDVATREMFGWLCEYNRHHPEDKVVFYGFDTQEIETYQLVRDALEKYKLDPDGHLAAGISDCVGAQYKTTSDFNKSPEYAAILAKKPIDTNKDKHCLSSLEEAGRKISDSNAVLARTAAFSAISFENMQRLTSQGEELSSSSARDEGMAKTFQALHAFYGAEKRAVIWAHNFHIKKTPLQIGFSELRFMGSRLKEMYGETYFPFALSAYRVLINWPWLKDLRYPEYPVGPSLESDLHEEGYQFALVDFTGTWFQKAHRNFRDDPTSVSSADYRGLFFLEFSPGNIYQ